MANKTPTTVTLSDEAVAVLRHLATQHDRSRSQVVDQRLRGKLEVTDDDIDWNKIGDDIDRQAMQEAR